MGISKPSAGKGSAQRQSQVPADQVAKNWDQIFGKKEKQQTEKEKEKK